MLIFSTIFCTTFQLFIRKNLKGLVIVRLCLVQELKRKLRLFKII